MPKVLKFWYKDRLVSDSTKNHTTASIQLFSVTGVASAVQVQVALTLALLIACGQNQI